MSTPEFSVKASEARFDDAVESTSAPSFPSEEVGVTA